MGFWGATFTIAPLSEGPHATDPSRDNGAMVNVAPFGIAFRQSCPPRFPYRSQPVGNGDGHGNGDEWKAKGNSDQKL